MVLIALFGAAAGQGVVWYTGQFYAMTFLEQICKVEFVQTRDIIAIALLIGTPFFIVFGGWSDRVGRKYIMLGGMLLAVFLYRPIYKTMFAIADVKTKVEMEAAKSLTRNSTVHAAGDTTFVYQTSRMYTDNTIQNETHKMRTDGSINETKTEIILPNRDFWLMIALVFVQVIMVTMVYGPIAAFLVELFPTRIRYTSMSLPYHIGNGIFGGLTPFIATWLFENSKNSEGVGDPVSGLWYPIAIAAACFVIGMIFLSNKKPADVTE